MAIIQAMDSALNPFNRDGTLKPVKIAPIVGEYDEYEEYWDVLSQSWKKRKKGTSIKEAAGIKDPVKVAAAVGNVTSEFNPEDVAARAAGYEIEEDN